MPATRSVYHITPWQNLPGIIEDGFLWCDTVVEARRPERHRIAYSHIKERRAMTPVPVGPRGTVAEYVPFYFAPRSPMLYAIHRGNVPDHTEGQTSIVHLVFTVQDVLAAGLQCVFTDGSAATKLSRFLDDFGRLETTLDHAVLTSQYWHDIPEDNDRCRRRQAEFLVKERTPWSLLKGIGVATDEIRAKVAAIVGESVPVKVRRDWYY